jgi:hypothetical protein
MKRALVNDSNPAAGSKRINPEQMKLADVETILERAKEKHPPARPRIISANGLQFIARDFKEFIRLWQTSHLVTTHLRQQQI